MTHPPPGELQNLATGPTPGFAQAPFPPAEEGARILVADDNPENCRILEMRLAGRGHTVTLTGNGLEALALARSGSFDLLLLDLFMPGLDGLQVLRHVKEDPATSDLPVIMISAHDETEKVVEAVKAGAEDYLHKPFEPTLLFARIGACLGKRRAQLAQRKTLEALLASQRALAAELGDAAAYLRGQLPPPLDGPISAHWRYLPSAQLGGDALGYQFLDPGHFAFFILDVCGHGVAAALHAISVMNLLRGGHLPETDFRKPAEVLAALNPRFFMEDHHSLYFTIWYGVYDLKSRTLRWANGGHPPPLLYSATEDTPPVLLKSPGGPAIGILPQGKWPESERTLLPGDQLFLFSDGLYEVRRGDGSMLDYDTWLQDLFGRFGNSLVGHDAVLSAAATLGAMEDDITVMTLKF